MIESSSFELVTMQKMISRKILYSPELLIIITLMLCLANRGVMCNEPRSDQFYSLHLIFFEAYLNKTLDPGTMYDTVDMPSAEFPYKFSRLFIPSAGPQQIQLPARIHLPHSPMILDVHTFDLPESEIKKKKSLLYKNQLVNLDYKVKLLSWTSELYQIELNGRYRDFKFGKIQVEGCLDKTKLVMIKETANRTLFIALTPLEGISLQFPSRKDKDISEPKLIEGPPPRFPSELSKGAMEAKVVIRFLVTREGKVNPEKFLLLDCPHYLFARNALDVVLNRWRFHPGSKNGTPIEFWAIIEIKSAIR